MASFPPEGMKLPWHGRMASQSHSSISTAMAALRAAPSFIIKLL
eukprot:CAMPEP_0177770064 /NCGR_PEP_ID=MMETSP0491_2-20121128/10706_1 /TAXON_ID=63592 /ORGANISM="Tetraselmis chuii, Strain PLY429" /LENGTH=43 /DNA_ID= /DNA_START= /DNA_END= /DNA_ORIENTATION=